MTDEPITHSRAPRPGDSVPVRFHHLGGSVQSDWMAVPPEGMPAEILIEERRYVLTGASGEPISYSFWDVEELGRCDA